MALSEREKRALKEKYKESRRASWGLRPRKRRPPQDVLQEELPEASASVKPDPQVSILRRPEEPVENIAELTQTATDHTGVSEESSEEPLTIEPVGVYDEKPPAPSEAEPPAIASTVRVAEVVPPPQTQHETLENEDQQLREKIKEQRRATWAGERTAPKLGRPPKRKVKKEEREFWSAPPEPEPRDGLSLGMAVLIVVGCIGVVAVGVLLGYLLTVF